MAKRCKILLFISIILFITPVLQAQEYTDFGTAVGVEFSKSLNKRFDISIEQEFRTKNNVADIDRLLTGVGGSYDIIRKYLKVGVAYNFIASWDEENKYFNLRHRANVQLVGRHDVQRFSFRLRSRYQFVYRDESARRYNWNPRQYWRNRLSVSYKIPKIALVPSVSCEAFYQLNNYEWNVIDNLRFEAGLEYSLNKNNSLELTCRYDHEINIKEPENKVTLGLFYKYSF
jgi:hypothetical protein